jgi:branched-chain amino acid transport system substrate-binding protein
MTARDAAVVVAMAAMLGCETAPPDESGIPVGLMLSYTGYLAANSVNSERAVLMAIEAGNLAGGASGRPLRLLAKDTRSDPRKVARPTQELLDAGVALIIGPDNIDLVSELRMLLIDHVVMLPNLNTSSDLLWKPPHWFVLGANIGRVACELVQMAVADGRKTPLVIMNPNGYNSSLGWDLANRYGLRKVVLADDQKSTKESIRPIISSTEDSFVLAAFPPSAASLVSALTAAGALDASHWYLSPPLHTPFFLGSIPRGALTGAHGVAPGTVAGAADFRQRFVERWHDEPLDDAYPSYDAAALAVLAVQRAIARDGMVPPGTGMAVHLIAVSRPGGVPVRWSEISIGLELLRRGQEIEYIGVSGIIEFDAAGVTPNAGTRWWTIADGAFADTPRATDCR